MKKVITLSLLVLFDSEAIAFQLQPLPSATALQISSRSVRPLSLPATQLYSSFSDLSGKNDQDDKIKILLDSLDSIRETPIEPKPIEEDPMDDMVEKMALPLKFFKGKVEKKETTNDYIVTTENARNNEDSKSTADDANPTLSDGNIIVKPDESDFATLKTSDEMSSSSKNTESPKETIKAQLQLSSPAIGEETSTRAIFAEQVTDVEERPATVAISTEGKSDTPTIQKVEATETKESEQDTTAVSLEDKSSDKSLFRKIFDREQVIDKVTTSQSPGQTDEVNEEAIASTSSDQSYIDSNLKALIQTIQPSVPSLSSFTSPGFGNVEFGLVGGAIVIISLYLSLAAYLRGIDNDEGYAEWDQYKRIEKSTIPKKELDVNVAADTASDATAGAISYATQATTRYGLVNKGQNPFLTKTNTEIINGASTSASKVQQTPVTKQGTPTPLKSKKNLSINATPPKSEDDELFDEMTPNFDRLDKIEQEVSRVESIIATEVKPSSIGSIEVQKLEEYCEPNKIDSKCSESISGYLDSLSKQQVDQKAQKAAAQKIFSYLDSLSSTSSQEGPSFIGTVPTRSKVVVKKESSQTSAAFSSYLDALSSGSVQKPPTAQAVGGYLDVLSAEASSTISPKPNEITSQKIDNRVVEVEDRLNRLETSVASLPDSIASRLIEWQSRQDQKMNDEIEMIKLYLMSEHSKEQKDER